MRDWKGGGWYGNTAQGQGFFHSLARDMEEKGVGRCA